MADVDVGYSAKASVGASELAFDPILIGPGYFKRDATFRVADDGHVRPIDCRGMLADPSITSHDATRRF